MVCLTGINYNKIKVEIVVLLMVHNGYTFLSKKDPNFIVNSCHWYY